DISYYLMDYYNWRRPHCHNDGMPPAKAEERPNQVSGFSWTTTLSRPLSPTMTNKKVRFLTKFNYRLTD
ncbi:hypothetical protein, partial [Aeromonas veronii]|uniref:hypothetical protein n=2 Tax=Aeromonas TaxID=642 RepID=UPI00111B10B5